MKRRLHKQRLKRRQVSQPAKYEEVSQSDNLSPANTAPVEPQHQEAGVQQQPETGKSIPTIRIRTISPREIIEAGGATAWAEKMGHTSVADEVADCIPMSDEEFEDLLRQLENSK